VIDRTTPPPTDVARLLDRARQLQAAGRPAAALPLCQRVWDDGPDDLATLCQLGTLYHQLGEPAAALRCFQRAATRHPDNAAVQFGQAAALQALGRPDESLAHYDRTIALRPTDADALNNRGSVLQSLGRTDDALRSYDAALALCPTLAIAHYNRGNLFRHTNRPAEALGCYDRALALHPELMEAINNRGVALQLLNRHAEALDAHDQALALRPTDADALNNRAAALLALNRHAEARICYDRAVASDPDMVGAHVNRAYCLLAQGDFARGWAEQEWRWRLPNFREARRNLPQPRWEGGPEIDGKTILLWPEQGLGDVLQFCRYVPLVAARATVVLEAPQPLVRLLCSLPGGGQIIVPGQTPPRFDLHCPLMSLPRAFRTDIATIPHRTPYLEANPAEVTAWRRRLAGLTGLRVGLVWAGNPRDFDPTFRAVDQRRSLPLAELAPLARLRGVDLVSLQKGEAAGQVRDVPPGMVIHDWTDWVQDFADTAALIEALDLVISVDTSVVHLAGALGKPVWVLNRFDACWRWLIEREDSPWYPSARLFNQTSPGDWAGVVARVAAALRRKVAAELRRKVAAELRQKVAAALPLPHRDA
jgi:tetratricopeptide (TPR) repeat protein